LSLDATDLLNRLRPVLTRLEADLLERTADPGVQHALADEHARETEARRTADPLEVWTHFRVTQIAAAWVLSLLFVRTLEDRDLVPHRLKASDDHRAQLRALAPYLNDRDYLLLVFRELTRYRGVRDVFDAAHNPVWTLGPSAEVAAELLAFAKSEQGLGGLDFSGDTRFLGDVYEQLDEGVRKRYALLQTPDFVEAFILDRTLTPALAERGVDGLTLIDPTCGSGHFLLGAFERLREAWKEADPAGGPETWAFKAVHQVYGADINPYAVAIARFRLVLAYVDAAEVRDLDEAGDLRLNLAVADSLLPVEGAVQQELAAAVPQQQRAAWGANPFAFAQGADAQRVLGGRAFDVVVGNPPYITVKDATRRDEYRRLYSTAHRDYQLVVPFIERFFQLALGGGWAGAIVSDGFAKRQFGVKLIQDFLPTVDVSLVVDTSGAHVEQGLATTLMLFGRGRSPLGPNIQIVMGKEGEPSTPAVPAEGLVWSSVREHFADDGFENRFISVESVQREDLADHPWALRGGGASQLKKAVEGRSVGRLKDTVDCIGVAAVFREDDLYEVGTGTGRRWRIPDDQMRDHLAGVDIRDWAAAASDRVIWPYVQPKKNSLAGTGRAAVERALWPWKGRLASRTAFKKTQTQRGLRWFEYSMLFEHRLATPLTILFPKVATHGHFTLDTGGRIFNASTHIIKLPPAASLADYYTLLAYLNSSTACFWLKQVLKDKGSNGAMWQSNPALVAYEFSATQVGKLPVPDLRRADTLLHSLAAELLTLGQRRATLLPGVLDDLPTSAMKLRDDLSKTKQEEDHILGREVVLQEAIDWLVYGLVGLCDDTVAIGRGVPEGRCQPGERPFEIAQALSRKPTGADGQKLATSPPQSIVEADMAEVWRRRVTAIETTKSLRLLETSLYKRRWFITPQNFGGRILTFADRVKPMLQGWLLARAEAVVQGATETLTVRQLARALQRDPKVLAVAEVYSDQPDPDLERLLTDLVNGDAVPFLAAHRYKPKGLQKYHAWERTWDAQRREDAGEDVEVPLPPKYKSGDFARSEYWKLRGKLDVPKERFIAYPGLEDEDDPTLVLGWAGWDHADRIAALGALVENEPDPDKKVPLLAGMLELLPWVVQWHGDDTRYGTPLGELWTSHLEGLRTALHLSDADLRAWRPPKKTRGRKSKGGGRKKVTIARDDLLDAFAALHEDGAEGVARNDLAEQLGVSSTAVGKAAQPLLDEGVWVVAKKRPLLYALTAGGGG